METSCANSNCAITALLPASEWVTCSGLCTKSFHVACIGINKRASTYLNEYRNFFLYYCAECREISLADVLQAIKCNNDSISSILHQHTTILKKFLDQLGKSDSISKGIDDLFSLLENHVDITKSRLLKLEKSLTALSTSFNTCLDERVSMLSKDLRDTFGANLSIHNLSKDLNTFRDDFNKHQACSSRLLSELPSRISSPLPQPMDPEHSPFTDATKNICSAVLELSNARRVFADIIDEFKSLLESSSTPCPTALTNVNSSLLTELRDVSPPRKEPSTSPPAPPSLTISSASTQCVSQLPPLSSESAVLPAPPLYKFGTSWTEDDWNQRLQKLRSANGATCSPTTALLLIGAPPLADADWIRKFFISRFSFVPINCMKLQPTKRVSLSRFKISIPSKYAWIFPSSSDIIFSFGNIRISAWTNKSVRFSSAPSTSKPSLGSLLNITSKPDLSPTPTLLPKPNPSSRSNRLPKPNPIFKSNPNSKTNPRSKPNPSFNHQPAKKVVNDSNWQLKATLFPNFNYATKYPNFIKSHTLNPVTPSPPDTAAPRPSTSHNSLVNPSNIPPTTLSTDACSPDPPAPISTPSSPVLPAPACATNTVSSSNPCAPSSDESSSYPSSANTPRGTPPNPSYIDPLFPPIVKLTMKSADSTEGRYLLSRFRDRRIYDNVRLLLAYLHDKSNSVCFEGKTKTNILVSIHQEGLPTDIPTLRQLYFKYHEELTVPSKYVSDDLTAYASYVSSRRISYLQKCRTDSRNYFRS